MLYKYYGVKLQKSRQKELVREQLRKLLSFSLQEEKDREGISESINIVAYCHLPQILEVLEEAGHFRQPKSPSELKAPTEDLQTLSERWIRTTLILCYGQAVLGAQANEMVPLLDNIVSEILGQYGTMNKDEGLKTAFMRSIIMITKAVAYSKRQDIYLPRKQELVMNIIEAIEEHPARALSVVILHKAIVTITCMSRMKPPLNSEMRAKVASKSIEKVFSLPPLKMTTLQASSPAQSTQTQDFYHQTVNACNTMLTSLLSEAPNLDALQDILMDFYHQTVNACNTMLTSLLSEAPNLDALQDILMHTNPWIESSKSHEKKRALKSTRHLLKFVSENVNFDITAEFFLLGRLVALLALHIGDTSKEVGQTSAEAAYYLHHLLMSKMVPPNVLT
ncbi:maestro heat-like repeat family member 5 [Ahaetulla prasina]|uniref:maestro heat-like repeat family member 5 n=1 Tax=Ahaetulla prasina TaxID=499056 RepID=UPI0026485533|nr:maestro heat-like repeat family member 5 [Ahaetulla prasina]